MCPHARPPYIHRMPPPRVVSTTPHHMALHSAANSSAVWCVSTHVLSARGEYAAHGHAASAPPTQCPRTSWTVAEPPRPTTPPPHSTRWRHTSTPTPRGGTPHGTGDGGGGIDGIDIDGDGDDVSIDDGDGQRELKERQRKRNWYEDLYVRESEWELKNECD